MNYSRDSSEDVVHTVVGNAPPDTCIPNPSDSLVWATEDDYRAWNDTSVDTPSNSNSNYQSQRSGNEQQLNKKSRNNTQDANSKSKAIGKMFFKTKLCCKFRNGTCPYVTNCNFAHSIEELRRPPPNWQEIVAAHEEERAGSNDVQREEFQIPSLGSSNFVAETQRSHKGRHCKKFYTEEGCPYGDNCTFLHDEQSKNRESAAISLGPGGYGGGSGGAAVVVAGAGAAAGGNNGGSNVKPSNWKTRICNKWELTGYCPFGNKCHFAHGVQELHRYGGGLVDSETKDSSDAHSDSKQRGVPSKIPADTVVASVISVPHADVYHIGVPSQRSSVAIQWPGQGSYQKWKGPDKISRIYGDWIDDVE
ncbi:zinc finger CCCH domain-containing protein 12-like isoform X1 [Mangifera indica]|uniref:zinc finger CCCH domain-containing protein 12-like isoform X1 n=1 Tax=Mangifera indica TaxID=29780 RepID=UPI001CF9DA82|nr:zinc finger CCCH domain-containing protein 12-like isoform X1 [Mangifera indica]